MRKQQKRGSRRVSVPHPCIAVQFEAQPCCVKMCEGGLQEDLGPEHVAHFCIDLCRLSAGARGCVAGAGTYLRLTYLLPVHSLA